MLSYIKCPEISITVTSWWARWRFKSPASRLFTKPFIQAQIKENTKAPRHWPLSGGHCAGNSPVTGELPAIIASNAENISIWWRHHGLWLCWGLSVRVHRSVSYSDTSCVSLDSRFAWWILWIFHFDLRNIYQGRIPCWCHHCSYLAIMTEIIKNV